MRTIGLWFTGSMNEVNKVLRINKPTNRRTPRKSWGPSPYSRSNLLWRRGGAAVVSRDTVSHTSSSFCAVDRIYICIYIYISSLFVLLSNQAWIAIQTPQTFSFIYLFKYFLRCQTVCCQKGVKTAPPGIELESTNEKKVFTSSNLFLLCFFLLWDYTSSITL